MMKHCMVVDDSDVIRKVARTFLERLGYTVSEAATGEEALSQAESAMPDIVLMDWMMPGTPPIDAIEQLRRIKGGRDTVVVYMTTENDERDIARAKLAGANEVLLKPFDRVSFEGKINEIARFN